MKRLLVLVIIIISLLVSLLGISHAETNNVEVVIPEFDVRVNNVLIDTKHSQYPVIVYNDVTYFPMTYDYLNGIGLSLKFSKEEGLKINATEAVGHLEQEFLGASNVLGSEHIAQLAPFPIEVNKKTIDNNSEPYPILLYKDITYFPMTWRFTVDEFGWTTRWDNLLGLSIVANSKENSSSFVASKIAWVRENPEGILSQYDDGVVRGLELIETEFGKNVEVSRYYTDNPEKLFDYRGYVEAAAENNDIVVTCGFFFKPVIQDVALNNLETIFVTIDFIPMNHEDCDDNHLNCKYFPNVISYNFKEEEGSFLVGLAAGETTFQNIVGFLGGQDIEIINKFEYGYQAGVKTVNSENKVIVDYVGSFSDPSNGFVRATKQHEIEGADIIFHASGKTGVGLFESAELHNYWAIGVDVDQSYLSPENVLCSMVKRVDTAVYTAIKSLLINDSIDEHVVSLGIAENGVDCSDLAGNLSDQTVELIEHYKTEIIEGLINVPRSYEELLIYLVYLEK